MDHSMLGLPVHHLLPEITKLLGRKVMTNLDIILKSRDITLPTPSSQFSSVTQLCPTLCKPMDRSKTGLPVHPRQLMKKQRHCLASKGPCSQSYGFSSSHVWTIKKAERQRIDAFELWCWRRLLRVPWTARRSNQSILKEISPGCSLEGLMLKLKLQYFGHLS